MTTLPSALNYLSKFEQFVLYRASSDENRPGKTNKFPCDKTGTVINAHDPENWLSAEEAYEFADALGIEGQVGFVLTERDNIFCLDMDDCYVNGEWTPLALELYAALPGCAFEVSRSGTGAHLWGTYTTVPAHGCKNTELGLELYTSRRFIALGLDNVSGDSSVNMTDEIVGVINKYFPPGAGNEATSGILTSTPCAGWDGIVDDDKLIEVFLKAKTAEGSINNRDLWERNVEALIKQYPSQSASQDFGESEADSGLASKLAFYTGKDGERIKRLMLQSPLRRAKYDVEGYLDTTISKVCQMSSKVFTKRDIDAHTSIEGARLTKGSVYVDPQAQLDMWDGCTYVADVDSVLMRNGTLVTPAAFKNSQSGFYFVMKNASAEVEVKTTDNAFEAFVGSKEVRQQKADTSQFRPDLPELAVFEQNGLLTANTYRDTGVRRIEGDASPFVNHLRKLIPDERDAMILLSYFAGCVQFKGHKFQWSPVIQGVHGTGKSTLSRCVSEAIGQQHCHPSKPSQILGEFNSWILDKILITVEDIWSADDRNDLYEKLKTLITESRQGIRAMRVAETQRNVVANFIFNSNHKNAINKAQDERRFADFFTAQQKKEHLVRDGLTPEYFTNLYRWLEKEDGYAIVSHFLANFKIPAEYGLDFLKGRAPTTTSTLEAQSASLGRVEQEIEEAAAQGKNGFAGGWINSESLNNLINGVKMASAVPLNKRKDMLESLGYIPHPNLKDGRSGVMINGARPRLFIKRGHPATLLTVGAEIVALYNEAQMTNLPGLVSVSKAA